MKNIDLDFNSLDAKLKEKEEEIRKYVSDEEYHAEMDTAAINVYGDALAKLYDSQKRKQYGKEPNIQSMIAREMAAHIKSEHLNNSTEDQIAEQIINNSKTHLKDDYYDN